MQSLRFKLLAPFIAGTLALTVLLAGYTYYAARQSVRDAVLLISEAKTEQTTSSMALLFQSMSTSLLNMVVDPHVRDIFNENDENALEEATKWLEIVTQGNEFYRDIMIVDRMGVCLASSNPSHVGSLFMSRRYVRQALGGRFTLGESSVGRVTKKFSAVMAGPVDIGNQVEGAVVLINDFPRIVNYSDSHQDDQAIFTALLTPDGMFAAHKDKNLMGNRSLLHPDLYSELSLAGEQGQPVDFVFNGREYVGYAQIEPTSKWIVLTSGLKKEVFAPAYRIGLIVSGISLAFLLGISFIVIRFANGILSSLLSLIHYAKRVSEGDVNLKLADTERNDELGVLHTSLRRLVQAMHVMLNESRQASNMKGQFLANMSHEIRTPLNAIIGMSHLSLKERNLPPKLTTYLDKIQISARVLLGLINDILDISKVEAGMIELEHIPFSLRDTLENSIFIHQESADDKGLELRLEYDINAAQHFIGDSLRIGQIVNNLLSNALKFTREGSVTIHCWQESCSLEGARQTALIRVSVTDTGIGMEAEALETLFKPFTQADASITRQFGGTGLGLAISNKLVEMLMGTFTVDSAPGKGSTFTFSMQLEIAPEELVLTETRHTAEDDFEQLQLQGKKILVAEDNVINQFIIEELMGPTGATVLMVNNGQEAVDAVMHEKFDIVFMDLQMPVLDGFAATVKIRESIDRDTLPIIAVTANAMKEDKDKGFVIGMNGYITKPIEPHNLMETLREWLVDAPPKSSPKYP